jgi:hypothetical protein
MNPIGSDPTLMASFKPSNFLKALFANTTTVGGRNSTYEFLFCGGEETHFSSH